MLVLYSLLALALGTIVCIVAGRTRAWLVQAAFAGAVVACMVTASKLSPLGDDVVVSVAIGLYSMTFLLTDYLGEVFGKAAALRAVWMGVLAEVVMLFALVMSINVEPASFWEGQDAFARTLGTAPRVMVASIAAFVVAQLLDVQVFDWFRRRHGAKYLGLRNNVGTVVSQTADTVIFYTVAFAGVVPDLISLIVITCLVKYAIALVDTPFIYIARWAAFRREPTTAAARLNEEAA